MKKVAFFLDNSAIASKDCSNALDANPGIGGTEWLFIVVPTLLSDRKYDIDVCLYTTMPGHFPSGLQTTLVKDVSDAILLADRNGIDYLVIKHLADNISNGVLEVKPNYTRLICWCHVFVCHWELDFYADNDLISKVVFVGREMYDLYRDHRLFSKATYIYNCVPIGDSREVVSLNPFDKRKNVIAYVGSLVPFKGFHLLAEAWPKIKEEIPDAELYVIGSGKLYDENSRLGKWGIAEESYENRFMPHLLLSDILHPDVHFMGVMGEEKKDILLNTRVGVPNPSGITETFCLSAVEMQLLGCKIATISYPGYMDTVRNGVLYDRRVELAQAVVDLLKGSQDNYQVAMDYFEAEFSYESVAIRWEELFMTGRVRYADELINPTYRLKWLKELLRKIKQKFPILYSLPMLERILLYVERKRFGRVTYIDS